MVGSAMSCTHQGNILSNGSLLFTRPNVVTTKNCRTSKLHNQVARQPQATIIEVKKKKSPEGMKSCAPSLLE